MGPESSVSGRVAPSPQGWDETVDGVVLVGVECGACGATRVPWQPYGCEVCGATGSTLRRVELPAVGRLTAAVTVFRHSTRSVPFTLGEIEVEGGPVVVALLSGADEWLPVSRVEASMVEAVSTTPDDQRLPVFSPKRTS